HRIFTERQQTYSSHLRHGNIYTPQAVVDGRAEVLGSDEQAARSAAVQAAAQPHGTITALRRGNALHLEATLPPHSGAEVLLAAVALTPARFGRPARARSTPPPRAADRPRRAQRRAASPRAARRAR